jgi:hypothetical protein
MPQLSRAAPTPARLYAAAEAYPIAAFARPEHSAIFVEDYGLCAVMAGCPISSFWTVTSPVPDRPLLR